MSQSLEKLTRLLAEMFQLDQAELDFGIYRIMNYKRDVIQKFITSDLPLSSFIPTAPRTSESDAGETLLGRIAGSSGLLSPIGAPCNYTGPRDVIDPAGGAEIEIEAVPREWDIDFSDAVEAMVRGAVENCAPRLFVPALPRGMRAVGAALRLKHLSPTSRGRITVVDRSDKTWMAVRAYVLPIYRDLKTARASDCVFLAENLYYLALATLWEAQFYCDVSRLNRTMADILHSRSSLTPESSARLALIKGTVTLFRDYQSLPGLKVLAGREVRLRDRIEEILDDAYLNEASLMRRFLSYEANRASVRRDLRSLLRTVTRVSKWAKGFVSLANDLAVLPSSVSSAIGVLLSNIGVGPSVSGPVLLEPTGDSAWRKLLREGESWLTPVRPLEKEVPRDGVRMILRMTRPSTGDENRPRPSSERG